MHSQSGLSMYPVARLFEHLLLDTHQVDHMRLMHTQQIVLRSGYGLFE
jgi:hypothetical protein